MLIFGKKRNLFLADFAALASPAVGMEPVIMEYVKIFKDSHPGKLFVHEAARRPELMARTHRIIGDGIRRFLDYAVELKEKQPEMFDEMMADYAISARLGGNHG